MNRKSRSYTREGRTALALVTIVLLLMPLATSLQAQDTGERSIHSPGHPRVEVEPELLAQVEADETTGYMIYFRERADLSPAFEMDWHERGWFVMNALQETADRTQARVRAYLDARGSKYQTYWIDNVIWVEHSDRATFDGLVSYSEIAALRAQRMMQVIEPVQKEPAGPPGILAMEPNLTHINVDQVWGLGYHGEGMVVANIDTGVRYTHNALEWHYRGCSDPPTCSSFDHDYNWLDPLAGDGTHAYPYDDHGHGSHTMGIMIGDDDGTNQIGMAPGARWIACDGCSSSAGCPGSALLTCAQWIAAPYPIGDPGSPDPNMRPHVVNNSWGDCGTSYDNWYQGSVDSWHAAGIYPVFSNGNASNCYYPEPPGCNTVGNPARYGNVTGIGSTGQQNGQYASHSNWGPTDNADTVNPRGYPSLKPQVLAPGVNIRSSLNGSDSDYASWGGTSMSAPHVSGLIALVWQACPDLIGDYATTETLLETTATAIPYASGCGGEGPGNVPNHATGWGEIDAIAAVNEALNQCNPDFTLDATPDSQDVCAPNDAVYNVDVGQVGGFSDSVDLSTSGQPSGTTVSFSVNPVTPPGASVLTIGNTGAATPGTYNIDVIGTAPGPVVHQDTVTLNLYASAPSSAPTLSTPANGTTNVPLFPTFTWSSVANAASYYLEVATDPAFSSIVYNATETDTSHTASSALAFGTMHYWRVTAQNACGSGSPSGTFSFTTITVVAPGGPIPLCMDGPMLSLFNLEREMAKQVVASPQADGAKAQKPSVTAVELAAEQAIGVEPSVEIVEEEVRIQKNDAPPQIQVVDAIANVEVAAGFGLSNDERYVSMDTDSDGNIYLAYEMINGDYDLVVAKSTDNGLTWDVVVLNGSGNPNERYPELTVDDAGYLWIAYKRDSGSGYHPAYWRSDFAQDITSWNGSYWSGRLGADYPAIDVLGSGGSALVYIGWIIPYETFNEFLFNWSADGGSTWAGWSFFNRNIDGYYPAIALSSYGGGSYANLVWQEEAYSSSSQVICLNRLHGDTWSGWIYSTAGYPDVVASGGNVYWAYQYYYTATDDNVVFRYSTDGGQGSTGVSVAATGARERYPAVSASGAQPRVAYFNGTDAVYLELPDADYGTGWSGTAYQMDDASNTPNPQPRYLDVVYHQQNHPAVAWSADPSPSAADNVYYSALNDPPVPTLAAPGDGSSTSAYAPTLSWSATDPDGDTLRYRWYADAIDGSTLVGGPTTRTESLPYFTAPGTTYYWRVQADDGYETVDSAVWSFTTSNETLSGVHLAFDEGFASDPGNWTRKSFACLDCFEGDPIRWAVSPADTWERSTDYAWGGSYSVHARYDANNADYQMTSPALDLRGASWAYFNTHYRGSSEDGADYLYLEARPDGASPWTRLDARSGDWNSDWWTYYEANVDLGAYAGTNTGQVRLRFETDSSNYGGAYGVGWYEDEIEVARESAWAWNAGEFYRLQDTEGAWAGYTNNLVDQLYSPYILLPDIAGQSIRLILVEQYNVASGDEATVWVRDTAADTWQQLTSYSGSQGSFTYRVVEIPDSYKGAIVVIALALHTDDSGTLYGPEEAGGYWDVDRFVLRSYDPTAVKVARFEAWPDGPAIHVEWETVTEFDTLGFNLYRSDTAEGAYVQLNDDLIPSQAPGSPGGAIYAWRDEGVAPGATYYYRLEDVDVYGAVTLHGPLPATAGALEYTIHLPLVIRHTVH